MGRLASVAALNLLVSAALLPALTAQTAAFNDPANLRRERPTPLTGRELPIDQPEDFGGRGLEQMLRRLGTRASLMLIVAHPDDEDGGMLTLNSRGLGARVATLTLTRGEGGQNAMTGDFEDALGLIRTQELLAADRYMGVDQMFGTEVDFGFSKTKEEAFGQWTHQRVLYDAVRAVRLYRPLVLAAVFVGGVTDGHGQHQVSGEICQEVFKAAGDPTVFPELTREGILPWRPLKVYARVPSLAISAKGLFDYATNQYVPATFTNYVTGTTSREPPSVDIVLHEGKTDPLLTRAGARPNDLRNASAPADAPMSYVQFARIGLGLQRSQIGPGVRLAPTGVFDVSYHRYGSRLPTPSGQETTFFDGVDTSLPGILSLSSAPPRYLVDGIQQFSHAIDALRSAFNPRHASASAPALATAQYDLGALLDRLEHGAAFPGKPDVEHELRIKQAQLNQALTLALGLRMEATAAGANGAELAQSKATSVKTSLEIKSQETVHLFAESVEASGDARKPGRAEKLLAVDTEPHLTPGQPFTQSLDIGPALTAQVSEPYFFRNNIEQPFYDLRTPALRNSPATPPSLTAWATLRYGKTEVQLGRVVSEGEQPVRVVPPASLSLSSHAALLPGSEATLSISAEVHPTGTPVTFELPSGWHAQAQTAAQMSSGAIPFTLTPPATQRSPVVLHAAAHPAEGSPVKTGFRPVGYGDLPRTNYFTEARLRVVPANLNLPRKRRIGYLAGTGDAVADNLRSVGLPVTMLTVADLNATRLADFDTVVLGVRTYNAHPDLHGAPTQALLDFARNGGNVVVQYQTLEFTAADAPYPLSLGNAEKVVDERAPVRLQPGVAVLASPNTLSEADFNGWVEERGHGFLRDWDSHYLAPTETHDPGSPAEHVQPQEPQRGGLITASVGKGHWSYVAFALYRQLPEAVPGAFRLFSNLLGLADAGTAQ